MAKKTNTQKASVAVKHEVELPKPAEELNGKKVKQPKSTKPEKTEKQATAKVEKTEKVLKPLEELAVNDQIAIRFIPADKTTPVTRTYKPSALEHAQKFAMKYLGEDWTKLKSTNGRIEIAGVDKKDFLSEIERKPKTDVAEAIIAKGKVHAQMNAISVSEVQKLISFAEKVNVENPDRFLELTNVGLMKMNLVNSIAGHVAQGLRKGHFTIEELQNMGFDC